MRGNEDWLMRPVICGLCRYESLRDGTLSLKDVSLMNEALYVVDYNRSKIKNV